MLDVFSAIQNDSNNDSNIDSMITDVYSTKGGDLTTGHLITYNALLFNITRCSTCQDI